VWLFFENSTGCLISQCQVIDVPAGLSFGVVLVGDFFGNNEVLLLGQFFPWFLLESLILAQDERWRRA
jgi:hypothetical protein